MVIIPKIILCHLVLSSFRTTCLGDMSMYLCVWALLTTQLGFLGFSRNKYCCIVSVSFLIMVLVFRYHAHPQYSHSTIISALLNLIFITYHHSFLFGSNEVNLPKAWFSSIAGHFNDGLPPPPTPPSYRRLGCNSGNIGPSNRPELSIYSLRAFATFYHNLPNPRAIVDDDSDRSSFPA